MSGVRGRSSGKDSATGAGPKTEAMSSKPRKPTQPLETELHISSGVRRRSSGKDSATGTGPKTEAMTSKQRKPTQPAEWNEEDFDSFCKWFWYRANGNKLIDRLNAVSLHSTSDSHHRVRREVFSPTVYAVVINKPLCEKDLGNQWRLCKVGFTHVSTVPDSNTRIGDVIKKTEVNGHCDVKPLFSLPISFVDTSDIYEVEERIRGDLGYPLDKDLAKYLKLPVKTEWVLSSQGFLTKIRQHIDRMKDDETSEVLSTNVFQSGIGKFEHERYKGELPTWLLLEEKKLKLSPSRQ